MDIDNLNVGFVLRNFGKPMTYGGEGLGIWAEGSDTDRPEEYYKVDAASFDLPYMMDMSASYVVAGVNIGCTFTSNYYATDEIRLLASYDVLGLGTVRAGYQQSMATCAGQPGSQPACIFDGRNGTATCPNHG